MISLRKILRRKFSMLDFNLIDNNVIVELPCNPELLSQKIKKFITLLSDPRVSFISNSDIEYNFFISYDDVRHSLGSINEKNYFDLSVCLKFYAIQNMLNPNFYSVLNKLIGEEENG